MPDGSPFTRTTPESVTRDPSFALDYINDYPHYAAYALAAVPERAERPAVELGPTPPLCNVALAVGVLPVGGCVMIHAADRVGHRKMSVRAATIVRRVNKRAVAQGLPPPVSTGALEGAVFIRRDI